MSTGAGSGGAGSAVCGFGLEAGLAGGRDWTGSASVRAALDCPEAAAGAGGAGGAGGARPSSTSSFLDCCSTARRASQLENAATSIVRLGVSKRALERNDHVGRMAGGRAGGSRHGQARIQVSLGQVDIPAYRKVRTLCSTAASLSRACPEFTLIVPSAIGIARPPVASAISIRSPILPASIGSP